LPRRRRAAVPAANVASAQHPDFLAADIHRAAGSVGPDLHAIRDGRARDFSVDIYQLRWDADRRAVAVPYMLNNQQPAPFTVYSFNLDLPMTPAAVYGISFSNPSGAGLLDIYDGGALLAKGGADGQTYVPLAGTADISNLRLDFREPDGNVAGPITTAPEPGTVVLMLTGLVAILAVRHASGRSAVTVADSPPTV
jgi:hypothetical protein